PRRKIDAVPRPAGVEGPLQGGGVVGAAVAHGAKGRRGDVEAALGRLGAGPHPAHGADLDLIGGIRRKARRVKWVFPVLPRRTPSTRTSYRGAGRAGRSQ